MSTDTVDEGTCELDVRGIDGEPFGEIMDALDSLPDDGALVLVNSFEPEPLYSVLEQRGYTYETSRAAENEWRVSNPPLKGCLLPTNPIAVVRESRGQDAERFTDPAI